MMTPDPHAEARKKLRATDCDSGSSAPYTPSAPPTRPAEKCTEATEIAPQEFVAPSPCPKPPAPAQLVPDPLRVLSEELTLVCGVVVGTGPLGGSVTVPAGQYAVSVYFQSLTGIQQHQLNYLGTLPTAARDALLDPGISLAEVRQITLLPAAQATELMDNLAAARAQVLSRAEVAGASLLSCYWENVEQTVTCSGVAQTAAPAGYEGRVLNPSVIPAGTYRSPVSQAAANNLALAAATQALGCLWGNVPVTATCHEDLGFSEAVPTDVAPQGSAPRPRVGSVTIAENTVYSDVSQEDANALALQLAISNLDCFYINVETTATCDPDADTVAADVIAATLDYGNPVTVPVGAVVSVTSTDAANAEAVALAASLLLCQWSNTEQVATCPTVETDGKTFPPSGQSPVGSVTIPAGEVQSGISRAAADAEALLRAQLSLDCLYCNLQVDPQCPPPSYIVTQVPIPLEDVNDTWSINATLGLAADTFCSPDPLEAQALADSLGNAPIPAVDVDTDCPYGNTEIQVSCVGDPLTHVVASPTAPLLPRGGPCVGGDPGTSSDVWLLPTNVDLTTPIKLARFDAVQGANLSSLSSPNPWASDPNVRQLVIAENFITVVASQVPVGFAPDHPNRAKLYATELAAHLALASTDCFFSNCPAIYYCHGSINAGDYNPPFIGYTPSYQSIYGDGTMLPLDGGPAVAVALDGVGSTENPLVIQEGQFTSRVSYAEMQAALQTYLLATLECRWKNPELTILCGSRITTVDDELTLVYGTGIINGSEVHTDSIGSPANVVKVPAGFSESTHSPFRAELEAFQLGLGQLNCFFRNTEQTVTCNPGPGDVYAVTAVTTSTIPAGRYESQQSQSLVDTLAELEAARELNCVYASRRVYIAGSGADGGGGDEVASPCALDETRYGPNSLAAGSATSTEGTNAATTAAATQLQQLQMCAGPGGGGAGNDGAQTNCQGPCFGYFS